MIEYPKIENAFFRNSETKELDTNTWRTDEFKYLQYNQWVGTEKVDGTNVRVITNWNPGDAAPTIEFRGRTDKAQLHPELLKALDEMFQTNKVMRLYNVDGVTQITLYGEGYGPKVQSGGKYRSDMSFVLFDVRIGDWWLKREGLIDVAWKLEIDIVPLVFLGDLHQAREFVSSQPRSHWGDFTMEGLVLQPIVPLRTRRGDRVVAKIKSKDVMSK